MTTHPDAPLWKYRRLMSDLLLARGLAGGELSQSEEAERADALAACWREMDEDQRRTVEVEKPTVEAEVSLFVNIKARLPALRELLADSDVGEDGVYRFYHGSFKVFDLQQRIVTIVEALSTLAPGRRLNESEVRIEGMTAPGSGVPS